MFKRMRDMVVATIHEGLDRLEDPKVMLNQYMRDMETEIAAAKQAIIKQQALGKGFEQRAQKAAALAVRRKQQAELALKSGEEELARKALAESKHFESKANQDREQAQKTAEQVRELREQLDQLEKRFDILKDKKQALIARANAAKTKKSIAASIHRMDSESTYQEFQRLENRIMEMEIEANTIGAADWDQGHRWEHTHDIERELEKMKSAMPSSADAGTQSHSDQGR